MPTWPVRYERSTWTKRPRWRAWSTRFARQKCGKCRVTETGWRMFLLSTGPPRTSRSNWKTGSSRHGWGHRFCGNARKKRKSRIDRRKWASWLARSFFHPFHYLHKAGQLQKQFEISLPSSKTWSSNDLLIMVRKSQFFVFPLSTWELLLLENFHSFSILPQLPLFFRNNRTAQR